MLGAGDGAGDGLSFPGEAALGRRALLAQSHHAIQVTVHMHFCQLHAQKGTGLWGHPLQL